MFEAVPLYVSGARHEAVVLRVGPYVAFSGNEGVVGPYDWKIVEGDTAGEFVNVLPGAGAMLASGPQQDYQTYAALSRTQTQVAITPTDSSGPRSDLVIVQVEDPNDGSGLWSVPVNPEIGPYVFARVIQNVPADTTSMQDIEGDIGARTAIACARVDLPASTATVTNSMITDLRQLADPHTQFVQKSLPNVPDFNTRITTNYTTSYTNYPQTNGAFSINVPRWATDLSFRFDIITAIAHTDNTGAANMYGNEDVLLNGVGVNAFSEWNFDWNGGTARYPMSVVASGVDVTSNQGKRITLQHRVAFQGGVGGVLQEDNGTFTFLQAYFTQRIL